MKNLTSLTLAVLLLAPLATLHAAETKRGQSPKTASTPFDTATARAHQDAWAGANEPTVYPPLPNGQFQSDRYVVSVYQGGKSHASFVYRDPNNDPRWLTQWPSDEKLMTAENHFTTFSFSGLVEVQIKLPLRTNIASVVVRPLTKRLEATIRGNTICLLLNEPANLFVEVEGEKRHPLFVFANPPEVNIPSPSDPHVLYFGPGIHDVGLSNGPAQNIDVGKTVYLAGGAYVKGVLKTTGAPGTTTIRGRGILSGIDIPGKHAYHGMIEARRCALHVEGIILLDAPQGYQGIIAYGKGATLENVKMLAWAMESDSGVLGPHSRITNCFFKINDDVLKPIQPGMLFQNNVVWQQMCGSAIMLGWNSIEHGINATVSGLDIIGCDRGVKTRADVTSQAIVSLKNSNGATYTGMTIENIRLEKPAYMLFGLSIKQTDHGWTDDPLYNGGLGCVDGLIFRNITTLQVPARISEFNGNGNVTSSSSGDIKNITFENIQIAGTMVTATNAAKYIVQRGKTSGFRYIVSRRLASEKSADSTQ